MFPQSCTSILHLCRYDVFRWSVRYCLPHGFTHTPPRCDGDLSLWSWPRIQYCCGQFSSREPTTDIWSFETHPWNLGSLPLTVVYHIPVKPWTIPVNYRTSVQRNLEPFLWNLESLFFETLNIFESDVHASEMDSLRRARFESGVSCGTESWNLTSR